MPYAVKKRGSKYVVVKEGTEAPVLGTHPSEQHAKKQIAAIYAHENARKK